MPGPSETAAATATQALILVKKAALGERIIALTASNTAKLAKMNLMMSDSTSPNYGEFDATYIYSLFKEIFSENSEILKLQADLVATLDFISKVSADSLTGGYY